MWRVGSKVPVNIYKGDQIVGQCQTPELAAEIVDGLNRLDGALAALKPFAEFYAAIKKRPIRGLDPIEIYSIHGGDSVQDGISLRWADCERAAAVLERNRLQRNRTVKQNLTTAEPQP